MAPGDQKSPQETVSDLVEMTKTYALQETVEPIKGLGKFVGYGFAAALVGGFGVLLVLLGILRCLQTETGAHFTGSLTWVPYLVTLIVALLLAGIAAMGINRKKERGV